MRVRVRGGYHFIRKRSYRNRWGEIRDKVLESIAGPCEIVVTLQEYKEQNWKLEPLDDSTAPFSGERSTGPNDPKAATQTKGLTESDSELEPRDACQNCGTELLVGAGPYCAPECRREAFVAAQANTIGEASVRGEKPDIVEFVTDSELLGLSISPAQEALLRTIYGLPLHEELIDLFMECTGRETPPRGPFGEVTVIAGARAGKDSRIAAPVILYEAVFGGHEQQLTRGESGVIPLVAQDARASKIAFGYIRDYITGSSLLSSMIEEELALQIQLKNGISIACFPSTLRSLRGWSIPAAVMDELAFFRLEGSADSDAEIQASIRRGMLSFPSPRLVKISTPYMKGGILWDDFRAAWGQDDPDRLVWKASSLLMNPSLKGSRLEREHRLDPSRFAREYEAEFSEDLSAFLPGPWIEGVIIRERRELPASKDSRYLAAVDVSGGGADAFTLAVVHAEGPEPRRVIQDVMRGWKRSKNLEGIVLEIAEILRRYRLSEVYGDRYGAGWVREAFQRAGIIYRESPLDKSQAYLEAEPLFAQGNVELLDHPQLQRELRMLERRPRAGGRDRVDHPQGGHDDHANALCLAVALALKLRNARPRFWRVGDLRAREQWVPVEWIE